MKWLERRRNRRTLSTWTALAQKAETLDAKTLSDLNAHALKLKRQLNAVTYQAEAALRSAAINQDVIDTPSQSDWAWRPDCWRGPIEPRGIARVDSGTRLGEGLQLFHDCPLGEVTLCQHRNTRQHTRAPYGLRLDILGFKGSFFSLVFDLPDAGRKTMRRSHIVELRGEIELDREIQAFARLNVKHGPNTEQLASRISPNAEGRFSCEFDLGHAQMNEKRLENVWLDIIFDNPEMRRIFLRDMTLMRRPRAEA